jgi:membrane associated rhomboid family serine protease
MAAPQPLRYESGGGGTGGFDIRQMRLWPVTYWIVLVNGAACVAQLTSGGELTRWGDFSIDRALHHWELWRFITYAFLHADFFHLLFNMFALFYFGRIVENRLGAKRYIAFYLICCISGALGYLLIWRLGFLQPDPEESLVGASAGVFGILVGVLVVAPHTVVRLLMPPVVMRIRTIALIFIGVAVISILGRGANAGGEAAHLGGALAGWILISNAHWLNLFGRSKRRQRFWKPGDPASNFFREDARP